MADWLLNGNSVQEKDQAEQEFKKIKQGDCRALSVWSRTYLTQGGWKRICGNVRQRKHIKGRSVANDGKRTLQIEKRISEQLKKYSESRNVTLGQAIEKMIRIAELAPYDYNLNSQAWARPCSYCGEVLEHQKIEELNTMIKNHEAACEKRPDGSIGVM